MKISVRSKHFQSDFIFVWHVSFTQVTHCFQQWWRKCWDLLFGHHTPRLGKQQKYHHWSEKQCTAVGRGSKKNILYPPIKGPPKKKKYHLNRTLYLDCFHCFALLLSYFLQSHLTFLHTFYLTEHGNCRSTNASIGFVCYCVTSPF